MKASLVGIALLVTLLGDKLLCIAEYSNIKGNGNRNGENDEVCVYTDYAWRNFSVNNENSVGCENNDMCRKTFNVTYIHMPSLTNLPIRPVTYILAQCCGRCTKKREMMMENITEITRQSINSSHFVFPVLGSRTTRR